MKGKFMKRFELRLPDDVYEKIWKIHTETRKSINQIIVDFLAQSLEKSSKK
jgi:predicted HicB family RNase H-like nuclease